MKKILQLISAFILTLSSLLTLAMPLAHAATINCSWTDASGTDNNFSTAGNWSCNGSPPSGGGGNVYNLTFPASAGGFDPVLDINNLPVGTVAFSGGGYTIHSSGGADTISISGGITDTSSGPNNEIDLNVTIAANQVFTAGANSQLILGNGTTTVALGSNNLTLANTSVTGPLTGSGTLIIADPHYPGDVTGVDLHAASPSFNGNISVNQGALFVDNAGALSAAGQVTVASGALLKGNGGVFSAVIQSGGSIAPGHSPGCITTNDLTISGTYLAQIGGTQACSGYDQLQVANTVNVTNATLQTSFVSGFTPTIGQSFEIIHNTGGNPIVGTFSGLAQGATFTSGGTTFQISYTGGSGNDVTLTAVTPSTPAGSASAPKAPATGFGAIAANPLTVFITSVAAMATLLAVVQRLKTAKRP